MAINRWMRALVALGAGTAVAAAVACGADSDEMSAGYGATGGMGGMGSSTSSSSGTTSAGQGGNGLPPEQELESSFGAPVATGNYVWIANPTSGRVAYIDAATLEIEVVDAGNGPTYLAAVPDPSDDVAIVLNVLSQDATLLRADAQGVLTADTLAVPATGNRWAIGPKGHWAAAWTDVADIEGPDPIDGYQDVSVLDLQQSSSTPLSVGYRPVSFGYDTAGAHLYAVTQDGITVISLSGGIAAVTDNVPLSDDPLEDTTTRDVAITADGGYALVRHDGDPVVRVFTLSNHQRTDVALPAPVTDLDLAADGSVAVAVVRDTSQVALLRLPQIATDPQAYSIFSVSGTTVGSVALAKDSSTAFLYTNATPSAVLTTFDSAQLNPTPKSILLHAPIQAVFPTADAAHAVVLHDTAAQGEGSSYKSAFSLVPVAAELPSKIVGLDQLLDSVAISPSGDRVLLATGGPYDTSYAMLVARLPSLKVDQYPLASRPISAGMVTGAGRGFVAQEHPDGRITFVDFDDGEVRTLTGFELATEVVDGSNP